ncbi:aminobenzoyl-glutamate transporter [Psychromonas marina]|uniref:Aminobenzoyl-glutamate transporter n=1 Tax=Psychromonas marina TaxID=88364 RepID=A0ABQ6DXV1_9GAMM|nr:AbgT family transporter [Psychromonas marina]GLS89973.1 aminobenzoyl-glutamate transporter [Psychromonas marina]
MISRQQSINQNSRQSIFDRIEHWGNKLPHPVFLFILLTIFVIVLSCVGHYAGWHYQLPGQEQQFVQNLISPAALREWIGGSVEAFIRFPPLGIIVVAIIGIGLADSSGLIGYSVQRAVKQAGTWQLTATILLLGVLSNMVGSVGYIVLIPLACRTYQAAGRPALAGLATAFAGVAGGTHATIFMTTYDVVIAGISTSAAQLVDPAIIVSPLANYYFLAASVILLIMVGTLVSIKIVEPRLANIDINRTDDVILPNTDDDRALLFTAIVFFSTLTLILVAAIHPDGWLSPAEGTMLGRSEVVKGLPVLVSFLFGISGLTFGWLSGTFKTEKDIIAACQKSLGQLGLFLLLIFFASQLIYVFKLSQISGFLAANFGAFAESFSIHPILLVLFVIISSAILNIFMGSPAVQWSMMAPVFIPTMLIAGLPVELTQVAFRIGDSVTNIISPLFGYLGIILATAQQYNPNAKIGTLVSMMLPFSLSFLLMWSVFLILWVFVFKLPLGI